MPAWQYLKLVFFSIFLSTSGLSAALLLHTLDLIGSDWTLKGLLIFTIAICVFAAIYLLYTNRKKFGFVVLNAGVPGAIVGAFIFFFIWFPTPWNTLLPLQPAYQEARMLCNEFIQPGMTHEEIEKMFGDLFITSNNPPYDKEGNGWVDLTNDAKESLDAGCRIYFKNGKVDYTSFTHVYF